MDETTIPQPPPPPPDLGPAGSLPGADPAAAAGSASPEAIAATAAFLANTSAAVVDMIFTRKKFEPMKPAERITWSNLWTLEVQRRPFLAMGGEVPELMIVAALAGMFMTRKAAQEPAEQQQEAPPAAA